jgi:hypothetical protein
MPEDLNAMAVFAAVGGFGNLIALPLQGRAGKRGNTVFRDADLHRFDDQWAFLSTLPPSRRSVATPITASVPAAVHVVVADGIYVDRSALPPSVVARLIRLAAFENSEFFRAQALRLSTYGKPRIISCAEVHPRHVTLPR